MPYDLIKQSKHLKNLYWLKVNHQNAETKTLYDAEKIIYKNNIKNAKRNYYKNRISNASNKTKETWNIINTKLGRKQHKNSKLTLEYENQIIHKPNEIASIFVSFFSTDAQNKLSQHFGANLSLPCTTVTPIEQSVYVTLITAQEVNEALVKQKNKNSSGFDELTAKILVYIKDSIIDHLVYLYNFSINEGCFPQILKEATVTPIYKKGSAQDIENFRQISVISIISKLFERIIYNKIIPFIEKNNILTAAQHGFRANKSTETATCHLLDYVYRNVDKGKYVISLSFDLSKAFDTINKEFLKQKLYNIGIRGNILAWFISYMEGRVMKVKVQGTKSEAEELLLGVPQGSVLGPLLFMLYINDLPSYISKGHLTMFADDFTVTLTADTPEELQKAVIVTIEEVSTWSQRNKLILNTNKTVLIQFYIQKPLPPNITLCDNINPSDSVKLLGTYIDCKLSFGLQVEHVCNQLNKAYFAILQMKSTLDETGLVNIYYALAYSHISYNIICWGSSTTSDRVFICQKRLVRLIYKLDPRVSCKDMFKNKKILTTPCIYIFKCLMYIRKNMDLFSKLKDTHTYSTRHGEQLSIPLHRTSCFERSPRYNCILFYNSLSDEIRNIQNYYKFKKTIKETLEKGAFYSIRDFLNREPSL